MNYGIASPWVQHVNKMKAMFANDPEVKVSYDNDDCEVKLYVDNAIKADALRRLLPTEKTFGTVTLKITIIPANESQSLSMVYRNALNGNEAFNFIQTVEGIMSNPITYVVFAKDVVQFYNDNLGDIYGNTTTLYQEIAKDIFEKDEGIFFCTDNVSEE